MSVDGKTVSSIGKGLLILVGIGGGDGRDGSEEQVERVADKVGNLRIFSDADGRMNLSLLDVAGEALVVSQFTLYADLHKGRRPSWADAGDPVVAAEWVEAFATALESRGIRVGRGVFGAHMSVELVNDGPVTIWLDGERP